MYCVNSFSCWNISCDVFSSFRSYFTVENLFSMKIYSSICYPFNNACDISNVLNINIFSISSYILLLYLLNSICQLKIAKCFWEMWIDPKKERKKKQKKENCIKFKLNVTRHGRVLKSYGWLKSVMNQRKLMSLMWQAERAKRNLTN